MLVELYYSDRAEMKVQGCRMDLIEEEVQDKMRTDDQLWKTQTSEIKKDGKKPAEGVQVKHRRFAD